MKTLVAALALLLAAPLAARKPPPLAPPSPEGLIDNVNGYADDARRRFTGLLVTPDGRVAALLAAGDRRPERPRFRLDGKGRTLVPALIEPAVRLVPMGLAAMAFAEPRPPLPRERDEALLTAQEALLARGITAVADIATSHDDWGALRRAGDAGRLRIRVTSYADGLGPLLASAGGAPTAWLYEGRLRMSGMAITVAPPPVAAEDDARLRNLASRAAMDNFQVAFESSSPTATTRLLDALDELAETYMGDRRWRLLTDAPVDLARLAKHGVIVGPRPGTAQVSTTPAAAARALRAEDRLGTLLPGSFADFILLDRDPVAGEAANVLETWVGGVRLWARKSSPLS